MQADLVPKVQITGTICQYIYAILHNYITRTTIVNQIRIRSSASGTRVVGARGPGTATIYSGFPGRTALVAASFYHQPGARSTRASSMLTANASSSSGASCAGMRRSLHLLEAFQC
jgi:hypothetical protein